MLKREKLNWVYLATFKRRVKREKLNWVYLATFKKS